MEENGEEDSDVSQDLKSLWWPENDREYTLRHPADSGLKKKKSFSYRNSEVTCTTEFYGL